MRELLHNLTGEQALEIVRRLAKHKGAVAQAVAATAKEVLECVDIEEIADEVFCALDCIDVQDCWDMAGASGHGYTSPDEAAAELVDEALQPFFDQLRRRRKASACFRSTTPISQAAAPPRRSTPLPTSGATVASRPSTA